MIDRVSVDRCDIRNGELVYCGVPLSQLAMLVGSTPFYAYDRALLRGRVADLRANLPRQVSLHYAMKANPMPVVVSQMVHLVDGIDVASAGELLVALGAGANVKDISFAGPGKRDAELKQAVAAGVIVNVESSRELDVLLDASNVLGVPARVAVRVNPDFDLKGAGMKMGGGPKPFGVDVDQVPALLSRIGSLGLEFEGFHIFSGSQNLRSHSICEAQNKAYELAVALAANAPARVQHINLGGGFGIPYFPGDAPLDLSPIGENLQWIVGRASEDLGECQIAIELGRYLVGEAGIFVTRVVDRKVSRGQVFLVCDGGLNHHLAASGNFGQVVRRNYPVTVGNRLGGAERETASVVGPLCTPLDLLADRMELPVAQVGDLVVVFQSGAYGATASPHGFLSHPPCAEILL